MAGAETRPCLFLSFRGESHTHNVQKLQGRPELALKTQHFGSIVVFLVAAAQREEEEGWDKQRFGSIADSRSPIASTSKFRANLPDDSTQAKNVE